MLLSLPPEPKMPKYLSPLINLANRFAQGTRPRVVGQMSELIKEFKNSGGRTFEEWKQWYLQKYPEAVEEATNRTWKMLNNFKETLEKLTEEDVRKWVMDLVLVKTYEGLMLQEAILKKIARELGGSYEFATAKEESKGIDGFIVIGSQKLPVSIKPKTYELEGHLREDLKGYLIIYEKKKDRIIVDYSDLLGVLNDINQISSR